MVVYLLQTRRARYKTVTEGKASVGIRVVDVRHRRRAKQVIGVFMISWNSVLALGSRVDVLLGIAGLSQTRQSS